MLAVAPAVFGPILVTLLVLVLNLLSTVLAALLTGTTIGAPSPAPQRGSRAEKRQPEPSRGFSEASCKPPSSRVPLTTPRPTRSEEHTSELQSHSDLVCRLLL